MRAEARAVHATVQRIVDLRDDGMTPEDAFTAYMVETLSERGAIENGVAVRTRLESPFVRCDGYGISNAGDVIYLVASHYSAEPEVLAVDRSIVEPLAKGLAAYCQFLRDGRARQLEEGTEQREAAEDIQARAEGRPRWRCIILTNRLVNIPTRTIPTGDGTSVTLEFWGLDQIASTIADETRPDEIEVDVVKMLGRPLPCLVVPTPDGSMKVYTAVLPGNFVADLYETYNGRILETNVRSFLRQTTKTNRGLRNSIRTQPSRFMAYNNGIVLTASDATVTIAADGSARLEALRGIQIVNGGQTTASLYMARANDRCDLSEVYVSAKIVSIDETANADTVRWISQFANTQNAVKQPDLKSGDALMRKIEVLSRSIVAPDGKKWFFERTSGQYGVQAFFASTIGKASEKLFLHDFPKERRFGKVDVAAWQHLWSGKPHEVSKGGQSNFDDWMKSATTNLPLMDERAFRDTVSAGIVTAAVKKVVKDESFPAYGAQIANFTVAYLAFKTRRTFHLDRVWSHQSATAELVEVARALAHWVDARIREFAGSANVTQVTKQSKLWDWLKDMECGLDLEAIPEAQTPVNGEQAKALITRG